MTNSLSPETISQQDSKGQLGLTEYTNYLNEIRNQPPWRAKADREMDYVDGNQLDAEILQAQRKLGMPPAIEPLIGPAIEAVLGLEAKTRTDWRVQSDGGDPTGDEVADALNYKLNQAERNAGADKACTDAFRTQTCVGIGWVEVARETDPFKYPYRCDTVHRNEIYWDFLSKKPDLSDARYLVRRRWTEAQQVMLKFPQHKDLISISINGRWTDRFELDGGTSTTLAMAWDDERGWSIEEQEWRDAERGRVCLFEVWYRRWEQATVIRTPDGRVTEYDKANAVHVIAVASGQVKPQKVTVSRMYVSFWMGPHKLHDGPSPYKHTDFPYVPFWANREDRTGVPYGRVRGMVYLQDNVNSAISKIRWGLSSIRTTRTKGAVAYPDTVFREQIARVDADIILNAEHMAQPGALFKVERDFQLNEQQYKMLMDSRDGISRASGITAGFAGQKGTATSGVQESTQIEQATQQLAALMDNFKFGRTAVGERLMSMIIEDIGTEPQEVTIRGNAVSPDKIVMLNQPSQDESGLKLLDNDVSRTRLKVALNDVPSTPSFRTQQLSAMSEAFKSMPQEYQVVALPHLLSLMDLPEKDSIIEAIKNAQQNSTPEQIQEQIDAAVEQALMKAGHDLKSRELELKYSPEKLMAEIRKITSEATESGLRAAFSAMQGAQVVATNPMVAPIADILMKNAGWQPATPLGQDPNIPQPAVAMQPSPIESTAMPGDTSPQTPATPMSPEEGVNQGINTMRADSQTM